MENFSKFSVANNHRNSFKSAIEEARNFLNKLDNDYSIKYQRVNKLSNDRKKYVDSLESKFKKYNLQYKQPLVSNDSEDIKKYAEELKSELAVSLVSLEEDKKDQVLEDSLEVSSEVARIVSISDYINMEAKGLLELEDKLSTLRVPERDSKEEVSFNFKSFKKEETKKEEEKEEESEVFPAILQEVEKADEIPADIFKTEETNSEDIDDNSIQEFFSSNFEDSAEGPEDKDDEEEVESNDNEDEVTVTLRGDRSLSDIVETIYGDSSYWNYVYNYSVKNRNIISQKAEEQDLTVDEAIKNPTALAGIEVSFPTEIVTFVKSDEEENDRKMVA